MLTIDQSFILRTTKMSNPNNINTKNDEILLRSWNSRRNNRTTTMNLRSLLYPPPQSIYDRTSASRTVQPPLLGAEETQGHRRLSREERCRFLVQTMDEALRIVEDSMAYPDNGQYPGDDNTRNNDSPSTSLQQTNERSRDQSNQTSRSNGNDAANADDTTAPDFC